jgi:YVTN family beta-propeller protein
VVVDTIAVPIRAFGVAVNPGTDRLYVSSGDVSGFVSVFNTVTDGQVAQIPVGDGPQGVAVDVVTNRIYAVNVRDQTVSVIDGNSHSVIDTIPGLDFRPRLLGINPVTNMIYVGNEGNGSGTTLAVINGATDKIVQNITVGTGPSGVAVNPITGRIYTANGTSNTVSVVDGSTNTVIATIPVGMRPLDVAVNTVTDRVYVSDSVSNTLTVIDGKTNAVIDTIPVGNTPRGISIDEISNQIYLTDYGDNAVSILDGNTDKQLFELGVGLQPHFSAYDVLNNRLYVANDAGASVSVIADAVPEPRSVVLLSLGALIVFRLSRFQQCR